MYCINHDVLKVKNYIFVLLLVLSVACSNPYQSPIPDVPVEISLNMLSYDPTFGGVIDDTLVFVHPRAYPPFHVGYGGVLVVVGLDTESTFNTRFFSYDLSCPYEAKRDVRVYTIPDNPGHVRCRECGSEFYVRDGWGRVSKGPSKYGLKRYQTDYINNFLIIRN